MIRFTLSSIICIVGMLYGFLVGASWDMERTNRFDIYLRENLQWIGENSDYDTSGITKLPVVVLADEDTLDYIWRMRRGSNAKKVGAFYSYEEYGDRVIHKLYLPLYFEPTRVYDGKTGVHEIVHFVQKVTGAREGFKCRDEGEYDAYNLAADWMEQKGDVNKAWVASYRAKGDSESICK